MNLLRLISSNTSLKLSPTQLSDCGSECIAYINPTSINVTTCGTKIQVDNVITVKDPSTVRLVQFADSKLTEVHSRLDSQSIIALANTDLLSKQRLFDFCENKIVDEKGNTHFTNCKHVKLLLQSKDIIIGK
jgi:hypothetical protein